MVFLFTHKLKKDMSSLIDNNVMINLKKFPSEMKNSFSSYEVKTNTTDLTTIPIDKDNKGYLVDQKLIDILLAQLIPVDFESFKADLLFSLTGAKNLEDLTTRFNNGVYIQTIIEKLHPPVDVPVASLEEIDDFNHQDGPRVIGKIDLNIY
jgi:hypothetical protein